MEQDTLEFDCTCINGTVPDVTPYEGTIPFFVCEENFVQCIENHPDDAEGQEQCTEEKETNCGTVKLSPTSAEKPSTSPASDEDDDATETPSRSGAQSTASSTSSDADADESDDAAPLTQGTNMGLLTSLVIAALGLLM